MIKSPMIISLSLLMAGVLIVLSASSNKKEFIKYQNQYRDLEDLKKQKLFQALDNIKEEKPNQVVLSLSTRELNEALHHLIKDKKQRAFNGVEATEFHGEIVEGAIIFYINKKLLNIVNVQFQFEFYPQIKNNNITLELTDARVGYIRLPRRSVLKYIKGLNNSYLEVDIKKHTIAFKIDLPKQFKVDNITVKQNNISWPVDINISNIDDLKEVIRFAVPPNISHLVDVIPFSWLIGKEDDISKRFTIKQIQTLINFVLKNAQ